VNNQQTNRDQGQDNAASRGARRDATDETVQILRGIWGASEQTAGDLDELFGPAKSCKSMQNVGFDGLAGSDGDMRAAWRATLQREGKLNDQPGSVRDLVLGAPERSDR